MNRRAFISGTVAAGVVAALPGVALATAPAPDDGICPFFNDINGGFPVAAGEGGHGLKPDCVISAYWKDTP